MESRRDPGGDTPASGKELGPGGAATAAAMMSEENQANIYLTL